MPCEILVVAVPKVGVTQKGFPFVIKDTPAIWGGKEGLPNWVKVRIIDASKSQVERYLDAWYKDFIYSIVAENALGYRIKVEVDPSVVSLTGVNGEVKSRVRQYLLDVLDASIVSFTISEVVVDIAKPVDLLELKSGVSDIFKERVSMRRYYFSDSDVDLAMASGGLVELTKAQVLSRIKDRYTE